MSRLWLDLWWSCAFVSSTRYGALITSMEYSITGAFYAKKSATQIATGGFGTQIWLGHNNAAENARLAIAVVNEINRRVSCVYHHKAVFISILLPLPSTKESPRICTRSHFYKQLSRETCTIQASMSSVRQYNTTPIHKKIKTFVRPTTNQHCSYYNVLKGDSNNAKQSGVSESKSPMIRTRCRREKRS